MAKVYQAYPEYKDSRVEWLGAIPKEWNIVFIKHLTTIKNGATPSSSEEKYWDGEISWVTPADLGKLIVSEIAEGARSITVEGYKSCGTQLVPKNSIIISSRAPIGTLGISTQSVCTNQGCKSLVPSTKVNHKFLYYFLSISSKQLNNLGKGTTFLELSAEELGNYRISITNILDQGKIANFLDHETAKIDTLIERQQQLIALLKEKRQAVISHAVTKGLNPNVKMKDSGVEWLGDVPEGWKKTQIKYVASIKYGIGEPPKYQEEGTPLIRATNIRSGRISDIDLALVNPLDIPEKRIVWLEEGDIIVVRSGASTGDSSIIPPKYTNSIAGFDMVLKPLGCLPDFLAHSLLSDYIRKHQIDLEKMRAAQPHLNAEELGSCIFLMPPETEQIEINKYIKVKNEHFDNLTFKSQSAIQLLQERRTALISAAVTGKIDLRDWQAHNW